MHSILVLVISANHTEVRVLQSILREQSEGEVAIVGSADRGEEEPPLDRGLSGLCGDRQAASREHAPARDHGPRG